MIEIIEKMVFTHYKLTGIIVKTYIMERTSGKKELFFVKVKDLDGCMYNINVPHAANLFNLLSGRIGQRVALKIEGYHKGGTEHFMLLGLVFQ